MSQPQPSAPAQAAPAAAKGPLLDQPRTDPRYQVTALLGSGGMAAVWRAKDDLLRTVPGVGP